MNKANSLYYVISVSWNEFSMKSLWELLKKLKKFRSQKYISIWLFSSLEQSWFILLYFVISVRWSCHEISRAWWIRNVSFSLSIHLSLTHVSAQVKSLVTGRYMHLSSVFKVFPFVVCCLSNMFRYYVCSVAVLVSLHMLQSCSQCSAGVH